MAFLDAIFGSTDVEQLPRLGFGQEELLQQLTSQAGQQFGQQPFQAQPLTPIPQAGQIGSLQQQALGTLGQTLGGFDPSQAQGILGQGQQALGQAIAPFDPASTQQFYQQAVVDPGRQQFQDLIGQISQRFAGQGAIRSGAFQKSLGRAATEFGTGQQAQLANLMFQAEQAQRNRALQAIPLAGGLAGQVSQQAMLPAQLATQALGAAGQQQALGQQGQALGLQQQALGLQGRGQQQQQLNQLLGLALGTPAFGEPVVTQDVGLLESLAPGIGAFLGTETGAGALAGLFGR